MHVVFYSSTCFSPTLVQGLFLYILYFSLSRSFGIESLLSMVSFFFFYFPIGYMDPFSVGFYSFSLDWLLLKLIEPSPMWNEKHTVCVCVSYLSLFSIHTHKRLSYNPQEEQKTAAAAAQQQQQPESHKISCSFYPGPGREAIEWPGPYCK